MQTHAEKIETLKAILAEGNFHHASTRLYSGTVSHGLYIYQKENNDFNGFKYALFFPLANHDEEEEAYALVRTSGVREGWSEGAH